MKVEYNYSTENLKLLGIGDENLNVVLEGDDVRKIIAAITPTDLVDFVDVASPKGTSVIQYLGLSDDAFEHVAKTHAIVEKEEEPPCASTLELTARYLEQNEAEFRAFCAADCDHGAATEVIQWLSVIR